MFDQLFSQPGALQRHRDGPLAEERAAYLAALAAQGAARGTLLRRARYCLCVAREVAQRPEDDLVEPVEIEGLATSWAAKRTASGRAGGLQMA